VAKNFLKKHLSHNYICVCRIFLDYQEREWLTLLMKRGRPHGDKDAGGKNQLKNFQVED
jgi:hypothetical protein